MPKNQNPQNPMAIPDHTACKESHAWWLGTSKLVCDCPCEFCSSLADGQVGFLGELRLQGRVVKGLV